MRRGLTRRVICARCYGQGLRDGEVTHRPTHISGWICVECRRPVKAGAGFWLRERSRGEARRNARIAERARLDAAVAYDRRIRELQQRQKWLEDEAIVVARRLDELLAQGRPKLDVAAPPLSAPPAALAAARPEPPAVAILDEKRRAEEDERLRKETEEHLLVNSEFVTIEIAENPYSLDDERSPPARTSGAYLRSEPPSKVRRRSP